MRFYITLIVFFYAFAKAYSQQPIGIWQVQEKNTQKVTAHVKIYKENNTYSGKIIKLFNTNSPKDTRCHNCKGQLANQPLLGMVIIKNLQPKGKVLTHGIMLDIQSGTFNDCKLWVNPDNNNLLTIRTYQSGLYRSHVWQRVQ